MRAVENAHPRRIDYDQSLVLVVLSSHFSPTAVFWQEGPIYWIHLTASPKKVVSPYYELVLQLLWKAQKFSIQTFGKFPAQIELFFPMTKRR